MLSSDTGLLPRKLTIFKGCKVIVTDNIDTSAGVSKGTKGFVADYDNDNIYIKLSFDLDPEKVVLQGQPRIFAIKRRTKSFKFQGCSINRNFL